MRLELYMRLLTQTYRGQVAGIELDRLRQRYPHDEDARSSVLAKWLGALERFFAESFGWPVIAGFGTSRDVVVQQPAFALTNQIVAATARAAVASGIGLNTGHFFRGAMGRLLSEWQQARQLPAHSQIGVKLMGVPLLEGENPGVQLKDNGRPDSRIAMLERDVLRSPPHVSFETRTPAIFVGGLTLGTLYYPGGPGTLDELGCDVLGGQHRNTTHTVWSGRSATSMPDAFLLDGRINGLWNWDSYVLQAYVQCVTGAANADDYHRVHVIRVGKESEWALGKQTIEVQKSPIRVKWFETPEAAAEFIVASNVRVFDAIRKQYSDYLSTGVWLTA